jgi:fatty acid CoA ligase FadD9
MASGVQNEFADTLDSVDTQEVRVARRVADLYATDAQFAAAAPIPEVIEAARQPGLRLPELIEKLVVGYADRPALGQRARAVITDPVSGRKSVRPEARPR